MTSILRTDQVDALPEFHAQHGEDRILHEYFGGRREGYFVEVGGFNGVDLSNTYFFEKLGWRGVVIEPHPVLAEACRQSRPRSTIVECAVVAPGSPPTVDLEAPEGAEVYSSLKMDRAQLDKTRRNAGDVAIRSLNVSARTLDSILEESGATTIDFLSVDVEGFERSVLEGFSITRWKPKVVILERDRIAPEPAILRYMCRNGYVYKLRTGVNDWYFAASGRVATSPGYVVPLVLVHYVARPALTFVKAALRPIKGPLKGLLVRMGLLPSSERRDPRDVVERLVGAERRG